MKKIILSIFVSVAMFSCKVDSKNKVETSEAKKVKEVTTAKTIYTVIPEKSTIEWKGFKPTGSHNGTISLIDGKIDLVGNNLTGGKFRIDMNSVVDLDFPADNEYNAKLIKHLKSAVFFDVAQHPRALFAITEVVKNGDKVNVSGNLTIKGIIKNITIPATIKTENDMVTFTSDPFKIDRTEFGIQYKSTKLADVIKEKSIDDLFEMKFELVAKK